MNLWGFCKKIALSVLIFTLSLTHIELKDTHILAPEMGKLAIDNNYIKALYQSTENTATIELAKSCYNILDGQLRRTCLPGNPAFSLNPSLTAKLILTLTGEYDKTELIEEWSKVHKQVAGHSLKKWHYNKFIRTFEKAWQENLNTDYEQLPIIILTGILALHPEYKQHYEEFKAELQKYSNNYSPENLAALYDFESISPKEIALPPAFNDVYMGYKGKTQAPICVENALRNITYSLLWNPETQQLDFNQINSNLIINPELIEFVEKHNQNLTSLECAQDWMDMVSGIKGAQYFRYDYELCGNITNGFFLLNYLFGTEATNWQQFFEQISINKKHIFAGSHDQTKGIITIFKDNSDIKLNTSFSHGHAQAIIERPMHQDEKTNNIWRCICSLVELPNSSKDLAINILYPQAKNANFTWWAKDNLIAEETILKVYRTKTDIFRTVDLNFFDSINSIELLDFLLEKTTREKGYTFSKWAKNQNYENVANHKLFNETSKTNLASDLLYSNSQAIYTSEDWLNFIFTNVYDDQRSGFFGRIIGNLNDDNKDLAINFMISKDKDLLLKQLCNTNFDPKYSTTFLKYITRQETVDTLISHIKFQDNQSWYSNKVQDTKKILANFEKHIFKLTAKEKQYILDELDISKIEWLTSGREENIAAALGIGSIIASVLYLKSHPEILSNAQETIHKLAISLPTKFKNYLDKHF